LIKAKAAIVNKARGRAVINARMGKVISKEEVGTMRKAL